MAISQVKHNVWQFKSFSRFVVFSINLKTKNVWFLFSVEQENWQNFLNELESKFLFQCRHIAYWLFCVREMHATNTFIEMWGWNSVISVCPDKCKYRLICNFLEPYRKWIVIKNNCIPRHTNLLVNYVDKIKRRHWHCASYTNKYLTFQQKSLVVAWLLQPPLSYGFVRYHPG